MNPALAEQRLRNRCIAAPWVQTPEAVVGWMGALQAQDYHQALWAVGARLAEPSLAQVGQAIAAGAILRTWPMRGTIHQVLPQGAAWMLALSAERMMRRDQLRLRQLDLDAATLDRAQTVLRDALRGGRRLTRPATLQLLEDKGIPRGGARGHHLLGHSALRGLICLGPHEGKQPTFMLLEEWAGKPIRLSREEGLARLAARYMNRHGPPTLADFAWWSGQTLTRMIQENSCVSFVFLLCPLGHSS